MEALPQAAAPREAADPDCLLPIETTGIFTNDEEPLMKVEGGQLVFKTDPAGQLSSMAAAAPPGGVGLSPLPPAATSATEWLAGGSQDTRGLLEDPDHGGKPVERR